MKLSLKPTHLKRYKDIGLLFLKYGHSDFASGFDLEDAFDQQEVTHSAASPPPEELANDLERMGPTFVKVGQLLSSRADLLPERFLKALVAHQNARLDNARALERSLGPALAAVPPAADCAALDAAVKERYAALEEQTQAKAQEPVAEIVFE